MKKKLILWTMLMFSVLLSNTFANNGDDLFGDLGLDTPSSWTNTTTTTTNKQNNTSKQSNNNQDLFGWQWETWGISKDNTNSWNKDNTNIQKKQLKELWYSISWDKLIFDVNYLPKESNFVVEFTGNRIDDIALSGVTITDVSGKVLDLWGLNNKINFIIVGGWNIKKLSLTELNKNGITIKKTDKVYLQWEFNDIDKQVLSTLLNNQKVFKVIFDKWNKVNELLPSKEGVLKNNSTLEIDYMFQYKKTKAVKKQIVKWKIVNEVRQKETWPTEVAISVLVVFMLMISLFYIKTWKVE